MLDDLGAAELKWLGKQFPSGSIKFPEFDFNFLMWINITVRLSVHCQDGNVCQIAVDVASHSPWIINKKKSICSLVKWLLNSVSLTIWFDLVISLVHQHA